MELNSKGELIPNFTTMGTRYSRYSLTPSHWNWSGIKKKKNFTTKLIFSINCERKKFAFPSSPRKFNRYRAKEGFVTFLVSIHAGKVKFLRGDVEKMAAGVGWHGETLFLFFFFHRIKVDAVQGSGRPRRCGIIPSGKVEIIKISNFQTGDRRRTEDVRFGRLGWPLSRFPYRACELRPNFELGKLETVEKKEKRKNCFLFDAWWRHRKITSFPTIIRRWLGYVLVLVVAVF